MPLLTRPHSPRPGYGRRGTAAVEMAVVLPVLLATTMGIVEFGRAMMVSNLLTTAAREGAREGALPYQTNAEVLPAAVNRLKANGVAVTNSNVKVYVNDVEKDASTAISGDSVKVTATVTFQNVTWLPTTWFISKTTQLQGQAVMRRE